MVDRVGRIQQQWERERPDLDVSPQGVFGRLHRLGDRLREELLVGFRQFGLGEGEFDAMAALRRAGAPYELAPGELARHTMVTTGAATKRIDRLEAAGLVSRHVSDVDGRGRVVALTEAGLRVIDDAFTAHIANEHRLLEPLSETGACRPRAAAHEVAGGVRRVSAQAARRTEPGITTGSQAQSSPQARKVCTAWPQRGHGRSRSRCVWLVSTVSHMAVPPVCLGPVS